MSCDQETALNNLRTFNYSFLINSTIIGRSTGNNVKFYSNDEPTNPTYEEYKLRRKSEILQYNNNNNNYTKKKKISSILKNENFNKKNNCSLNSLLKSTRNSNVPSYGFLYYNTNIPYYKNI